MTEFVFHVNERTVFGEDVVLNLNGTGYRMTTHNGELWSVAVTLKDVKAGNRLSYYYSVELDGVEVRHEWLTQAHTLNLTAGKAERYVVYDHWIGIPEDAYLYSSAFTDCINGQKPSLPAMTGYEKTVRITVRAPQLLQGQRLAIVGECEVLGKWDLNKAIPMTLHHYNEWTVDLDASLVSLSGFKFVALSDHGGVQPLWETGMNRSVVLPQIHQGEIVAYELDQAFFDLWNRKVAGTLVPVFSLRSRESFGVGDFGDMKKMIDFVAQSDQRVLQVLPINDTTITHTWTDSYPYSCISIFAIHPQYVNLNALPVIADETERKKFEALRQELNALPQIDYERVNNTKTAYLKAIYAQEGKKMMATPEYKRFFKEEEQWLVPYAQYSFLRDANGTADFLQWEGHRKWNEDDRKALTNVRTKAYREVAFYYFVQYLLSRQMEEAHEYARAKGVVLKGDIPIGVNRYGCDVWMEPKYFNLNGQAGAPPDDFSADGQNWGFPTYNWDAMVADGCQWWVRRFQNMSKYFDAYRIDHVLGFFRIWEIPVPEQSGLMGQFAPALAMTEEEISGYGVELQESLFLHDHRDPQKWHPRIAVQFSEAFQQMPPKAQAAFNRLYDDYFYHRNNQFWYHEAMKKLPKLVQATRMLVCAEDLGMVPDCVSWVMNELRILSLELQSMPKSPNLRFGILSENPYRSVCTISSHDMPTLRQWWDEDFERTQAYYNMALCRGGEAPHPLPGWLARDIIAAHLASPSMLCILSIQDWLAIDEALRLPDQNAERINIPANPKHYWRYRMHLNIEDLILNREFTQHIKELLSNAGRK